MFTIFLLYTIVMLSMFLEQAKKAGGEDHDEDFLCRFRGQFGVFNLRWSR